MEDRAVRSPDEAPASPPAGAEALVLRALGDAYAARAGAGVGGGGGPWPTISELAWRAALGWETVGRVLVGLERRGMLRLLCRPDRRRRARAPRTPLRPTRPPGQNRPAHRRTAGRQRP
jgi:hypothetical protein